MNTHMEMKIAGVSKGRLQKRLIVVWYQTYPKYSSWQAYTNSEDPDQMPRNASSDQDLYYLPLISWVLDTSSGCKMELFKF